MIRPLTLMTLLLAAGAGAYLFAVKHRAQVLDDEIAAYSQSSRLDAMRIRVLQGQWSLETDPTRLQQLAAEFTTLQPMQPSQLVSEAELKASLPPPGSAVPASNPALPEVARPALPDPSGLPGGAPDIAANSASPGALPLPPPQPPVQLASAASAAPERVNRVVSRRISHSALHLANTELAENLPPPKPFYASAPLRQLRPEMQEHAAGPSVPMGAQVMSVKASATVPQDVPQDGGSVLGMAGNLPPPQPIPQAGNEN
jgi:hypothetical protein